MPTSKPDPAVYRSALDRLGVPAERALALEDSVSGTRSAVAAGITTAGIVQFVPAGERDERARELRHAGAAWVAESWDGFAADLAENALAPRPGAPLPR
ncbi:HAD-IA family hydrolase [Streptomyces sp. NPDC014991]|uniref:HAD-IA family hydrolase n=1 Tax=Streptomyces sp. NPDC014991 TaxID=3364935 RepID=UPI0036F5887D